MPVLMLQESIMMVYPVSYSPQAVTRAFRNVRSFDFAGVPLAIIYDQSTPRAAIIKTTPEEINGALRLRVIAMLEITRRKTLGDDVLAVERFWQDNDALQINGVCVLSRHREQGLATLLYETLVTECGIVLMSDHTHYPAGKAL